MRKDSNYRRRLSIVLTVLPSVIGIFLIFFINSIGMADYDKRSFELLIGVLFMLTIMGLLMLYLQTGFKKNINNIGNTNVLTDKHQIEQLESDITNITEKVSKLEQGKDNNSIGLSKEKQNELEDIIKYKVINESTESVLHEMEEKINKRTSSNNLSKLIQGSFSEIVERLRREITTLNFRSNLNLVIGIVITMVGFFFLYTFVINGDLDHDTTSSFIMYFSSRIAIVIFIEIFAFFFLSLYKSSLSEIKYYHNEITKIEAKYIALRVSYETKSNETTAQILRELSMGSDVMGENVDTLKSDINEQDKVKIIEKVLDIIQKEGK